MGNYQINKMVWKKYGDKNVKRGTKHQYLGMDMDFGYKGEVKILAILYVEEIIKNFPEEVGTWTAATLAAERRQNFFQKIKL